MNQVLNPCLPTSNVHAFLTTTILLHNQIIANLLEFKSLVQGLATFFSKEPDIEHVRLCNLYGLC